MTTNAIITKAGEWELLKRILPHLEAKVWRELGKACEGQDLVEALQEEQTYHQVPSLLGRTDDVAMIQKAVQRNLLRTRVYTELVRMGISPQGAMNLYEHPRFGGEAVQKIKKNPYRAADVPGISFDELDQLAANLGFPSTSLERKKAAIRYAIFQESQHGNSFAAKEQILRRAKRLLETVPPASFWSPVNVHMEEMERVMASMNRADNVVLSKSGHQVFYSPAYWSEIHIADHLVRRLRCPSRPFPVDASLNDWKRMNQEQRQAIQQAWTEPVSLITGGPGTGKTTVLKCIVELYEKKGQKLALLAPTARAAQRMQEATGHAAETIHKRLGIVPGGFAMHRKEAFSEIDAVIIDEMSMCDVYTFEKLLLALENQHLILVGDADQLPSVGTGKTFQSLIECGFFPTTRLTKNYRSREGSAISELAAIVREANEETNDIPWPEGDGVQWVPTASDAETVQEIVEHVHAFLEQGVPLDEILILTPRHDGILGTQQLNQMIQARINHRMKVQGFAEQDAVLQVRNDYETNTFNGEIGRVIRVEKGSKKKPPAVTVDFGGHRVVTRYGLEIAPYWELGYAITVHKAQGSEANIVILPFGEEKVWDRALLYTAITRAKEKLILIGSREAFQAGVQKKPFPRRDYLKKRLEQRMSAKG